MKYPFLFFCIFTCNLSYSAIKQISLLEFIHHIPENKQVKINIKLPLGVGKIVALFLVHDIRYPVYRYLIKTKDDTYYLHHEFYMVPSDLSASFQDMKNRTGELPSVPEKLKKHEMTSLIKKVSGKLGLFEMIGIQTDTNQKLLDGLISSIYRVCEKAELLQP